MTSIRRTRAGRLRLAAWIVTIASCAPRESASDGTVARWLNCIECTDGERAAVAALGDSAVAALDAQLAGPPDAEVGAVAAFVGQDWSESGRHADSAAYVRFMTASYVTRIQRRAALSLGDIGTERAMSVLRDARDGHATGSRYYFPEVLTVIYDVLYAAGDSARWQSVSPGGRHTCGVLESARAVCWGEDAQGSLGRGAVDSPDLRPVAARTLARFASIGAGDGYSCGRSESSGVFCWGIRTSGQVGRGNVSPIPSPFPRALPGLDVVSLSVGEAHACAVEQDGTAWCWGSGQDGRLGMASVAPIPTPSQVGGLPRLLSVSAGGAHTCGVSVAFEGWCWGANTSGQIGAGTSGGVRPTPTAVVGPRLASISAGGRHTCAIAVEPTFPRVYCWGAGGSGQLGGGTLRDASLPQAISAAGLPPGARFVSVSAGDEHTCALRTDGRGFCWGLQDGGRLGNGRDSGIAPAPVEVAGDHQWRSITAGRHTCGVTVEGEAFCWGPGREGQIGDGDVQDRLEPTLVTRPRLVP